MTKTRNYEVTYDMEQCRRALVSKGGYQRVLTGPGLGETVISKFFLGKPVRMTTAQRIIQKLGLKWDDVATVHINGSKQSKSRASRKSA